MQFGIETVTNNHAFGVASATHFCVGAGLFRTSFLPFLGFQYS